MNPIIESIAKRISVPRLKAPAPDQATLDKLFKACLNVPDHYQMQPWRFLQVEGDARYQLGDLFAEGKARTSPESSEDELDRKAAKALRAPLIIVAICSPQQHAKVPELEQQLSTGCVIHNLGLALRSLGFASIWRTGNFAFDPFVQAGLGLAEHESIMGFLYVGTSDCKEKTPKNIDTKKFVSQWPNPD